MTYCYLRPGRIELAIEARAIKKRATPEQEALLSEKRLKLQKEIDDFHRNTNVYMAEVPDKVPTSSSPNAEDEWQDLDDDSDDEGILHPLPGSFPTTSGDGRRTVVDDVVNQVSAEAQIIRLPSTYGKEKCPENLTKLYPVEKDLRMGQANDALHAIRLAIADKSYSYRKKVRKGATNPNAGYRGRRKAFDAAHALDADIRKHARIYELARKALNVLGLSPEEQDTYRPLKRSDTQASTAVIDFNARGQRNAGLSWIWQTPKALTNTSAWMDECELCLIYVGLFRILTICLSLQGKLASC